MRIHAQPRKLTSVSFTRCPLPPCSIQTDRPRRASPAESLRSPFTPLLCPAPSSSGSPVKIGAFLSACMWNKRNKQARRPSGEARGA